MAKQNINVGTAANDKKGDSLRAAFVKVNANFTELYTALGLNADGTLNLGAFEFNGSVMSTTDSSAIVIDQAVTVSSDLTVGGDIVPSIANGGDLGSAAKPWKSLYVSGSTIYLGNAALSVDANGELLINSNRLVQDNGNYISLNSNVNDVQVSDLQVGDTLQWAGGFWVNGPDGGGVTSYNNLTDKPALFSGSYNDLTNKPDLAGTYQFSVAADDSTQRLVSTDEVIKFIGTNGITTASDAEGNITISKTSELVSVTVPTIGGTASASEAGITYLSGGLSKWAIFTEGAFTVGVWDDVEAGWTVTDNNGFTDTIAGRGSFGAASFSTTVNNWPSPASGKTYVFTSPGGYQQGYTNPIEITVGSNNWAFGNDGSLTFPNGTVQTTAPELFSFNVAGDDSTQRAIGNNELIKFVGAGGITTASDAEGYITITQGTTSSLVNGAYTLGLGANGALNLPSSGGESGSIKSSVNNINLAVTDINGDRSGVYLSQEAALVYGADRTIIRSNSAGDLLDWTFGNDGSLTIPGDIRSEGNINIDINLSDSTLRRWQFGEDGHLIFPGGTNIIESSADSLGIYSNNPTRTNGLEIFGNTETNLFNQSKVRIISNVGTVNRVWEFGTNGSLTFPDATVQSTAFTTSPTLNILKIDDGVHEKFQTKADATGVVTHDCALGHIIYHTSPDDYFTVNLTNLNLASGYATSITVVMVQGATGYGPNALQIGGVAQTINWQGGSLPAAPTANGVDVMTFSILNNSGTYTVLAQVTGFNEVA